METNKMFDRKISDLTKPTKCEQDQYLMLLLRHLEREGYLESSLDQKGELRWRCTEKGRWPDDIFEEMEMNEKPWEAHYVH
jgi:hypothetical protein